MNLFEYIKSQLPSMPNTSIMKDMGASDELIEYVKETPKNTNLGMLGVYGCGPKDGGEGEGEVWATITETDKYFYIKGDGTYEGEGATTSKSFAEWAALFDSPSDYVVSAITPSQVLSMTYSEAGMGGTFDTEDGSSVSIGYDPQAPDVSIYSGEDLSVPAKIIVTKK